MKSLALLVYFMLIWGLVSVLRLDFDPNDQRIYGPVELLSAAGVIVAFFLFCFWAYS